MLPSLPYVSRRFQQQHFECQSVFGPLPCPRARSATKLEFFASTAAQSFPAVQTFFPKFQRATRVQSSTSSHAFRTRTLARVLVVHDNGRGELHLHPARVRCGYTHMFAVTSRDVCPFTYPRASLFSFFPRATQQRAHLNA